ncbi:MAG: DUF4333 domain-containing protein [Elainellaceae cyanobacterium]
MATRWRPALACALSLLATACQPTLNTETIATEIYDALGETTLPIDAVNCPDSVPVAPGESFQCWGDLPNGPFSIYVDQEDDQGSVSWDIPNSSQVLNLSKLETYFRDAIREEMGEVSEIDCGGDYRVNRPGDRFDCSLSEAILVKEDKEEAEEGESGVERQLEAIQVQVDSQGNVNWQQVRNLIDEETSETEEAAAEDASPEDGPSLS